MESKDRSKGLIYLDAKQREKRRIRIENGLVYDHRGAPIHDAKSKRD